MEHRLKHKLKQEIDAEPTQTISNRLELLMEYSLYYGMLPLVVLFASWKTHQSPKPANKAFARSTVGNVEKALYCRNPNLERAA